MRRKLLVAVLVLLVSTAGLAGCLGDEDETEAASRDALEETAVNETSNETQAVEEEEEGPILARTWHNGSIEGGSVPVGWYCTPGSACDNTVEFTVPEGAQAILVEAAWQTDADAYLSVDGPECESYVLYSVCEPSDDARGASPLAIRLEAEDAGVSGTWQAAIWVDETTPTQIEPTLVATVVEEGELEVGDTAFDDA